MRRRFRSAPAGDASSASEEEEEEEEEEEDSFAESPSSSSSSSSTRSFLTFARSVFVFVFVFGLNFTCEDSRNVFGSSKSSSMTPHARTYGNQNAAATTDVSAGQPNVECSATHCSCRSWRMPSQYVSSFSRVAGVVVAGVVAAAGCRDEGRRGARGSIARSCGRTFRLRTPRPAPRIASIAASSSCVSRTTSCDCVPHRRHT